MYQLIKVHTREEAERFQMDIPGCFDFEMLATHRTDEHWRIIDEDERSIAMASLWWRNTPRYQNHRVGVIGHLSSNDSASGAVLLQHAVQRLREAGCTIAIGPMDGNTWRPYRMITDCGEEPAFFLEPWNSKVLPQLFAAVQFKPLADYYSAMNDDLAFEDEQVAKAGGRLIKTGICLRSLDVDHLDDELRRIYKVAELSFRANFLYTPLAEAQFIASYLKLKELLQPELILIAEQHGESVGFVFTVPDYAQYQRGEPIDTVIVKTVAVLPERRCAGLGAWLVAETQIAARRLGYKRAIHALMHESNQSRNLSARYAKTFRRYALVARTL